MVALTLNTNQYTRRRQIPPSLPNLKRMSCFLDQVKSPPPNDLDPTLTFLTNELFDKIHGVSRNNLGQAKTITERKAQIINEFIDSFKLFIGQDMFPSAKLIFPEKAGRLYFIRETVLARHIIKMYNIPKDSEDYNLLYHWGKQYHKSKRFAVDERKIRDLPLQASRVIAKRRPITETFEEYSVPNINSILDDLTLAKKSQEQRELLQPLFNKLRIEEIRWLIHILLKKAILTHMDKYFFNSWHPQGYRLYSLCNNLETTFNILGTYPNKEFTKADLSIHPRFKFKPQLAEKLSTGYDTVVKKLQKKEPMDPQYEAKYTAMGLESKFYIEEKMDGDRMLLHKEGNNFKFYSRRLKDYSFLYGETFQFGSLTKYLRDAFVQNVNSVILDGEMIAYDYERQVILPFGTLKSLAIQESVRQFTTIDQYDQQTSYPYYVIFDIVYLNGKDLSNYPLFFRKSILERIINPVPHRFEVHDVRLGSTAQDIERAIREVVTSRSEGLVLKHTQLKYVIDGFRNPNWIKVKPEYLETFGENLDLVVIGKNPATKNSYMVGLCNADDGSYYSFAMIANGFEVEEYDKIERLTHNKWIDCQKRLPPESIIKFGKKKPVYWINPKDSVVLEVKARSIDVRPEETYAVGSSLHGNFCRRIREDKAVNECLTLQEYKKLKAEYSKNLHRPQTAARKRDKWSVSALGSFDDPFASQKLKKIKPESDLFFPFEFLIMSDKRSPNNEVITVEELKALVKRYGGKVVNSVDGKSAQQLIAITEKELPVSSRLLKQGIDLVKPSWILECIKRNQIMQIEPHFLFATRNWPVYSARVDEYGDSFIIYNAMDEINAPLLLAAELSKLREKFDWDNDVGGKRGMEEVNVDSTTMKMTTTTTTTMTATTTIAKPLLYLFKDVVFHVIGSSLAGDLLRERIERFGGTVADDYLKSGFIVVPQWEEKNNRSLVLFKLKKYYQKINDDLVIIDGKFMSKLPHTVTELFIDKCIEMNSIADPEDYKFS